jgi:rubredoxin
MIDIEVDDDEWQLAAWFFKDQNKAIPLATLDYQQNLFAVTGTFRVQETDDDSYVVFSRQHFYEMFGRFPNTINKGTAMDQLVVCPYEYDASNMEFSNTISGGKPLLFHFAGNGWLCACTVFAHQDFQNVPKKFRDNCEQRYSIWFEPVQEGIRRVAHSENKNLELHITMEHIDASDERQLHSNESRDLAIKPYKGRKKKNSNPYQERRGLMMKSKSQPYKSNNIFRMTKSLKSKKIKMDTNDVDVPREVDDIRSKKSKSNSNVNNIFFHSVDSDSTNPYQKDMKRRRRRRRMRRRRGPRGLKEDALW